MEANDHIGAVQGCTDSWINGAVRGAEHRRVRRKLPEGARARCARVGCEHKDVLSDDPAVPEKHRGFCRARCAAKHRVRCLAFLVTFWALRRRSGANSGAGRGAAKGRMPGVMPKSNRLARRARRTLCTQRTKIKMDSRLRGNDVKRKELDSGLTSPAVESRRNDEQRQGLGKRAKSTRASAPQHAKQAPPPRHWLSPTSVRAPRGQ